MSDNPATPMKTYRGNCHCGAVIFEAAMPEIKKPIACNCSICSKKACIWAIPPSASDVTWVKGGLDTLRGYTFGSRKFTHKFCGTCGSAVCVVGPIRGAKEGEEQQPDIGLNVRCLQHGQVPDIWDLDTTPLDRASVGHAYEPPPFNGPEPAGDGRLYTGSCHCGAVRVAVKTAKPLDEEFDEPIYECNCSGCVRAGTANLWPPATAVGIVGEEAHTFGYRYGFPQAWDSVYCARCGAHLRPVNLRVLHGVDLGRLRVTRVPGYADIPPMYANP
ncbi:glutathione-dependent formaldehyde-activating enzyme [Xylariomycetidae sp. FL0641]|nr:glutathione-dependent formaldehyde-activating enzyme [Xylariomycetidae sp. FL0641]